MANELNVMTSHNLLNYSGLLFNKGNTAVPFSTLIGGKSRNTNHWEFSTSLAYTTGGGTSQPAISETASLTAPDPAFVTRAQKTNYCQIFQRTVQISYGKQSSMGQLSGLNIAGQTANPATELDFQVANQMAEMRNDIEYTFLRGTKQNGADDSTAYKTAGILNADEINNYAAGTVPLGYWVVAEAIRAISATHAPTDNLVLLAKAVNIMQLNADASANGLTVIPNSRTVNGLNISTLITPFGTVGIIADEFLPDGTALLVNASVCAPVNMPVPGKGNFFLEPLAKDGASDRYMIYGQLGLDYGAGWYHSKITGLTTTFTAPEFSKKVFVVNQ